MVRQVSAFENAVERTLEVEGVFSNRKTDRGGATKFGVTERVARANGYTGRMEDMTVEFAVSVYRLQYWDTLRLDDIASLSERIAEEMFDTAVNCGVAVAGRFLQQALNVLNRGTELYADLPVDGVIGPVSVAALKDYLGHRGEEGERVMLRALNSLQCARYIEIAEGNESQEDYVYGWILRRVRIE